MKWKSGYSDLQWNLRLIRLLTEQKNLDINGVATLMRFLNKEITG